MHVVAFVGSPLASDEKEIIRVAKKLKKESVVLDIVNFGETDENTKLLEVLVNTVNGKDSNASHLVTIPAPCAHLADALLTSPVMAVSAAGGGNDGMVVVVLGVVVVRVGVCCGACWMWWVLYGVAVVGVRWGSCGGC